MSPTDGQLCAKCSKLQRLGLTGNGPKAKQPEPNEHKLIFKIERLIWEGLKESQNLPEQTQGQLEPLQNGD